MNITLNLLEKGTTAHNLDEWWELIETWPNNDEDCGSAEAPAFFKALNPVIKDKDYIITTDVGQHQMWAAQNLRIQFARQFLSSGGLGTMGFGLPAAMGAKLARPEAKVISISGDGGFKMTGSELFTIAQYNIPVIAIVINNTGLGMIRQLQTVFFQERFIACELPPCTDFVKYAGAFGIAGEHVDTPEGLATAVEKAMELNAPYLIEVNIGRDNMVEPMVASGPDKYINSYVKFDK